MAKARFEWDPAKDRENQLKHGVAFAVAQFAFADPQRVIAEDTSHSSGDNATSALAWLAVVSSPSDLPTGRASFASSVPLLAKG